jgi:transglutaminase-like putative cysteine protease
LRAVRFPDAEVPKRPAVAAGAYLKPSLAVPSEDAEIRALAARITGGHADASAQVEAILAWMRANIGREPADVFSALDVLRSRRAECQGHAYLYAALARALGIPTRVVNGLVYSPELQGFAYHTWNESLLDGEWIGVDATLGQLGTDATHLGIVYGENPGDLAPLAAWIGRTRIEVLERR